MDYIKDPYFNVNKTNHLLNYMVRIPNYQGYVPKSVTNIKGIKDLIAFQLKVKIFHKFVIN